MCADAADSFKSKVLSVRFIRNTPSLLSTVPGFIFSRHQTLLHAHHIIKFLKQIKFIKQYFFNENLINNMKL